MSNAHAKQILSVLKKTYPHAKIVLNYGNNWELLVSVILSAQCTDKKVNEVTEALFEKYTKLQTYKSTINYKLPDQPKTNEEKEIANFATMPIEELEKDIKSTGFYHNKTKNIQGAARKILENFGGKIPRTMEELLTIPGVARKTANIVLGNAYGIISGIAVDTHVQRVAQRLRLVDPEVVGPHKKGFFFTKNNNKILDFYKDASPEKIEQQLMKIVPKSDWFRFTYWIIEHGRAICKAQKPRCEVCPLQKYCPASRTW